MTPKKKRAGQEHLDAIADLLYEETEPDDLTDLETIEIIVREPIGSHVSPSLCVFFIKKATETEKGRKRTLKSPLGEIPITEPPGKKLKLNSHTPLSPLLPKCCLRISANVSYENAAKDVKYLTGIDVASKTQPRGVQRTDFNQAELNDEIKEISVDGGKIRLRTPMGKPCEWRDYKAICLNTHLTAARFQSNQTGIDWVNQHAFSNPLTCLGDGPDGIWNIISKFGKTEQRQEILDGFHLKENLYKVKGSIKRLNQAESLLWRGKIEETQKGFMNRCRQSAKNFCAYWSKQTHRIVD